MGVAGIPHDGSEIKKRRPAKRYGTAKDAKEGQRNGAPSVPVEAVCGTDGASGVSLRACGERSGRSELTVRLHGHLPERLIPAFRRAGKVREITPTSEAGAGWR